LFSEGGKGEEEIGKIKTQVPNSKPQVSSPTFQVLHYTNTIIIVRKDLIERLLKFAVDVIIYLRTLKNTVETMDMKRQLIKSSTSSGANYEESQGSPTKPDAKTKIRYIS